MERRNGRIMVTGGAGFIGSELVRQLVSEGKHIIVVDNLINGKRENLEGLPYGMVQLMAVDIRDIEQIEALLKEVQIVFHLACMGVRHSIHSPLENHEINATATLRLLMAARAGGVERFVCVSSSEVYGTAKHAPMTEEHPTFPMTTYGASKLAGECYVRAFHRTHGYPTVVIRPFNTFGPRSHHEGDCGEVIPKFLLRCMAGLPMVVFGDGSQTRDFTYVSDTAVGIMRVGLAEDAVGKTINLGSGREVAIKTLASEIQFITGRADGAIIHDDPRPGDVMRLCADTTLAHRTIEFKPQVSLREGLTRLRDWYLSLGEPPEVLLKQETIRNWEISRAKAE